MRLPFYQKRQTCRSDVRAKQNGRHDMRSANYYVHRFFRLPFAARELHLLKVPIRSSVGRAKHTWSWRLTMWGSLEVFIIRMLSPMVSSIWGWGHRREALVCLYDGLSVRGSMSIVSSWVRPKACQPLGILLAIRQLQVKKNIGRRIVCGELHEVDN